MKVPSDSNSSTRTLPVSATYTSWVASSTATPLLAVSASCPASGPPEPKLSEKAWVSSASAGALENPAPAPKTHTVTIISRHAFLTPIPSRKRYGREAEPPAHIGGNGNLHVNLVCVTTFLTS